jgi:anti-sigma regulatory factor (Ser/Thr protein kinase)
MPAHRPRPTSRRSPASPWSTPVQQTFDAVSETVPLARRVLDAWLSSWDLGGHHADLELAVGELVTNAVRHGKPPIRLVMAKLPDRIRVEVHDCGGGRPAIRPARQTGPDAGGWGLRIVDQLVDTWGTDTSGDNTSVWVEQALPPSNR